MTKLDRARRRVADERRWLSEHGTSRAAYIARYGSIHDPDHYGDGGEAIHAADVAALEAAEADLRKITR